MTRLSARTSMACVALLLVSGCGGGGSGTSSAVETVLHSFGATNTDGIQPLGGLIQGKDGNFYGTTCQGGGNGVVPNGPPGDGTVYVITPEGVESVLYSFGATSTDGIGPFGGLIQGADGNFYGTTMAGGANGGGTVFMITPAGVETVLYAFGAFSTDGFGPQNGVIQGTDGNFYGTTPYGGANGESSGNGQPGSIPTDGFGTVFKITPAGAETVLYSFGADSVDGTFPNSLIQGTDGNFYGTTLYGGANNNGTFFKVTPGGVESVLYSFGGSGGIGPSGGLIQGADGNFYGTAGGGGVEGEGTVYMITAAGVETVLHSFNATTKDIDGVSPFGVVQAKDGNFYGTTYQGGTTYGQNLGNGSGTVFKVTPDGVETVLHSFGVSSTDGIYPNSGLIQGADGNLYGTTSTGGAIGIPGINAGNGTVFRITP